MQLQETAQLESIKTDLYDKGRKQEPPKLVEQSNEPPLQTADILLDSAQPPYLESIKQAEALQQIPQPAPQVPKPPLELYPQHL